MGTRTIGITDEVYDRLSAQKREGESFTELIDRLLEERTTDWREGFDTLEADADELEQLIETTRTRAESGLATRQRDALETLSETEDDEAT